MSFVKFPLAFEQSESLRLFVRKLIVQSIDRSAQVQHLEVVAPMFAYRIWMEWATCCQEWRPLKNAVQHPDNHPWKMEDLTYIIESFCQWKGQEGELMRAATLSEFIKVESREGLSGLVLSDFWKLNEHLSPTYTTIQQKGGHARALKLKQAEVNAMAEQRQELFKKQGILHFGSDKVSKEEEKLSYALVMRMDRACGLAVRAGESFNEEVVRNALGVIRTFTEDQILSVESFLIASRDNHKIVKVPDRILQNFNETYKQSQAGSPS